MSPTERPLHIASRRIGSGEPCYVIAEVGINHNGDLAVAKQLVDAAVAAGADAVKFQKRKLTETYREEIIDQPRHGEQGLQYIVPLLIEFELSDDQFRELFDYCRSSGITAMCTPWDRASVDFLETCDLAAYKIGSPDLTNFPLIEYVAATRKPMLLSTGMSTEEEVRRTLAFLAQCHAEYALFHCVSTYPAAPEEINLRFMERLREWSGRPVGYSGHDNGIVISLAAVAMGARMLERHLTLDRTMRGPDHKASLEPAEFAEQMRALREVEASIGVPHRWITRGETLNRRVLG
jgi:sialic acid synthase SpsE